MAAMAQMGGAEGEIAGLPRHRWGTATRRGQAGHTGPAEPQHRQQPDEGEDDVR